MSGPPPGTITAALKKLSDFGLRYGSVIDVGCADGQFAVGHYPLFSGAVLVNVDANGLYGSSLRAIAEVMGGHWLIAAVDEREGEAEMTTAVHPYWDSLRPRDDPYWQRLNQLHSGTVTVPATTIDKLVERLALPPPFLLKLDIQGAELAALRGGRATLARTDVVILEADLDDFHALHAELDAAGFGLFDITEINRLDETSLAWFYPIYLNRRHDGLRRRAIWDPARNEEVIRLQVERRKRVLAHNARVLAAHRAQKEPKR